MNLDLTKPIEVGVLHRAHDSSGFTKSFYGTFVVSHLDEMPQEIGKADLHKETQAYRRLFEAAPRMLAAIKQELRWSYAVNQYKEFEALIAEIEKGAAG